MAKKKISYLIRTIINIFFLLPPLFNLLMNLGRLIKYEVRVAGRSLVLLIILFICLGLLLTSIWICALIILFVLLNTHLSVLTSLMAIMGLNLLLALLVALVMSRVKEDLVFPETRETINQLTQNLRR